MVPLRQFIEQMLGGLFRPQFTALGVCKSHSRVGNGVRPGDVRTYAVPVTVPQVAPPRAGLFARLNRLHALLLLRA